MSKSPTSGGGSPSQDQDQNQDFKKEAEVLKEELAVVSSELKRTRSQLDILEKKASTPKSQDPLDLMRGPS